MTDKKSLDDKFELGDERDTTFTFSVDEAENQSFNDEVPRQKSSFLPFMLGLFSFVLLLAIARFTWVERQKKFPVIESGDYIGIMTDLSSNKRNGDNLNIFVRKDSDQDDVIFAVLSDDFKPQRLPLIVGQTSEKSIHWAYPLILDAPDGKIRITGKQSSNGYAGVVYDIAKNKKGTWKIHKLDLPKIESQSAEVADFKNLLLLKADLDALTAQYEATKNLVTRQNEELTQIREGMKDQNVLKQIGEEQQKQAENELNSSRTILKEKEAQARRLANELEVAKKITPMGNLVNLARESLERENRWVDGVLRK